MRKAIENRTRLVPVPPMLRGFMPQKYPITPIRKSKKIHKKLLHRIKSDIWDYMQNIKKT
ncbi:hypothetical protein NQ317_016256 [Molorchus minor]|uniref:Uncharacterized protein n=1 Tax=Molorchus minor TaxID=1323400 RepID=A0ABQ9JZ51_9CUCU|nr:hypothetical protein NQ317_016256 [Molorchus minor]